MVITGIKSFPDIRLRRRSLESMTSTVATKRHPGLQMPRRAMPFFSTKAATEARFKLPNLPRTRIDFALNLGFSANPVHFGPSRRTSTLLPKLICQLLHPLVVHRVWQPGTLTHRESPCLLAFRHQSTADSSFEFENAEVIVSRSLQNPRRSAISTRC